MKSNPTTKARTLRKNSTDAERKLWSILRNRQLEEFKFRRQYTVGKFIVDFICTEKGLIIEVDGGQHADERAEDDKRTSFLESEGYKVIRFWNDQALKEPDAVCEEILRVLKRI